MRQDISDLKTIVLELLQNRSQGSGVQTSNPAALKRLFERVENGEEQEIETGNAQDSPNYEIQHPTSPIHIDEHEEVEETLSLEETEKDLIQRALKKHNNKRKWAARELGISERTLYRKIKEYDLK
jgi:transcriptional regulator with PAS, ATPase and Fis domain